MRTIVAGYLSESISEHSAASITIGDELVRRLSIRESYLALPSLTRFDRLFLESERPCGEHNCSCRKCTRAKQAWWRSLGNAETWGIYRSHEMQSLVYMLPISKDAVEIHGVAFDGSLRRHTSSYLWILDEYPVVVAAVPSYARYVSEYLKGYLGFEPTKSTGERVRWRGSWHNVAVLKRVRSF